MKDGDDARSRGELMIDMGQVEDRASTFVDLFDFAPVAYWVLDSHGIVRAVNLTAAAQFGVERHFLLGRPFAALVGAEHSLALRDLIRRCLEARKRTVIELPLRASGDRVHALQLAATPHPRDLRLVLVIAIEVSERRPAEELASHASVSPGDAAGEGEVVSAGLREDFFARVSHELQTPVASMLLWAEVLANSNDPEEMTRARAAITRCAQLQKRLLQDFLDLSRVAAGKLTLVTEAVTLGSVVGEVVASVAADAARRAIWIESAVDGAAKVWGDRVRLRQVLANLLGNALKFSNAGGHVGVDVRRNRSEVLLIVRDEGIGFGPDLVRNIFEPFRQGPDPREGGLGLGLAIVKELVELHGGTISAESQGSDRGATFVVRLPRLE